MNKIIPYGKHHITQDDIDAVVATLKSDFLTQGPNIKNFEIAFSEYIGCKYAVAVSNGTAALHLSALALKVKAGDKIITTPITFAASANCIRYCGADVVFVDIDPQTQLLDINKVRELLQNSPSGTFKGIIPVDFAGQSNNLEEFRKLADEFGLWILEDACHAPGGYFVDSSKNIQNCGNSNFADLAIFSFHPVKHITSGEGGMITTNNEKLYKQLLNLRSHGIQQDPSLKQFDHGLWYYEMQDLGFNYRLSDIQASLGLSQLSRANIGLIRRKEIVQIYEQFFKGKEYIINRPEVIDGHAYHLYVVEFKDRDNLYMFLRNNNIFAQIHYIPVHLMPYYRQFGWKEGDFPHAEMYYSRCLSLPIYPTLTNEEVAIVLDKISIFYT